MLTLVRPISLKPGTCVCYPLANEVAKGYSNADVRELASTLCFMLRRSSLVECVSVLHGTCLQCAEKKNIHQYVKPCEENPSFC
jgi:hypothetical protein